MTRPQNGQILSSEPTVQNWTLVQPKAKANTSAKPKVKEATKRLILIGSKLANFSALRVRNSINKAFEEAGVKGLVVNTISKTLGENLVITTTSAFSAAFLAEKQLVWQSLIRFERLQIDEPWHKVICHGIPIAEFNASDSMALVSEEIKTFNALNTIGKPYWLTSSESRESQRFGSIVVAFKTEAEAEKAIRNRLYIAGISVRVTKHYTTSKSTQCTKCQGFGHLYSYCKKKVTCRLCGEEHETSVHKCNTCHVTGKPCAHLTPKCINCKGPHQANSRDCEVYSAIQNPNSNRANSGANSKANSKTSAFENTPNSPNPSQWE